jgi:branched-subunit amino acid transport protein
MDPWQGWLVVIVMAVGTFAMRLSMLGGMSNRAFAPWLERALTLVLPAIFAAIAAPMLLLFDGTAQMLPGAPRLIAAAVTLWTAIRWRGYLMPLVVGMVALHVAQRLMQG